MIFLSNPVDIPEKWRIVKELMTTIDTEISCKPMKTDIDTDAFYYVLERHCEKDGEDCVEHCVMAYEYDEKWRHCFDEDRMFANRADAEKKAMELNAK